MNLKMTRLEIIGLKSDLHSVVQVLGRLGCVQIDPVSDSPDILARPLTIDREIVKTQEKVRLLLAQVEGLLSTLGGELDAKTVHEVSDVVTEAQLGVATLLPKVQTLTNRRLQLQGELDSLPRYEATLHKLLPVVPPSAHKPGNTSVGIFVHRTHIDLVEMIGKQVIELTGGQAELVMRDVDESTRAMLLVFPAGFADEIEALLGREDVSRLRLPAELGAGPPDTVITALRQRLALVPPEIKTIDYELNELAAHWREPLTVWRDGLHDELEAYNIVSHFGETDMTFVIAGWTPARDFERVSEALQNEIGDAIVVRQMPITPEMEKRAPVAFDNPAPVRPFESLVRLRAMPRYGGIDPSALMALFVPLFFGMMLGDVGYGGLLLAFTLVLRRRYKVGTLHDIVMVLLIGSGWSIVFGVVFGEVFGTLGESLGIHPLLFDRASPEHVFSLLALTIGIGAAHVVLGLILGVRDAIQSGSRSHLLERGGMLVGLVALFLIVGVLVDFLPRGFMTPAIGGLIIGIVLLGSSMGWLGLLMGPIEFIGVIGNVMSYLRIAAIGLASVYLAKVANDLAGLAGNLIVGVIIAVLIHALNLVMGTFSPTIQSLRLHYVEFFRKFYEGGGRPYAPFRSQPR